MATLLNQDLQVLELDDDKAYLCGKIFGTLGADVIRIERVGGDIARSYPPFYQGKPDRERSLYWYALNVNKWGTTLDVEDVFMTNFRKDLAVRLKMDYNTLRKLNPRLIYCNATGYGTAGPWAKKRGFDLIGLARSGIMWAMGDCDQDEPVQVVGGILDTMGATMTAYGIMAALIARERTGKGQEIESSILAGGIHLFGLSLNMQFWRGRGFARHSQARARNPMANHYRCKDEKWMMLSELQSDRYWHDFCQLMELQDMEKDPRFDNYSHRAGRTTRSAMPKSPPPL